MGFFDKALNETKAAFNATSSKLDETIEVEKLESRIRDERRNIDKLYIEMGKEYYEYNTDKDEAHISKIEENIPKIDESKEKIADYEKQISDLKTKGKQERDDIRADADAKNKAIDEAEGKTSSETKEE